MLPHVMHWKYFLILKTLEFTHLEHLYAKHFVHKYLLQKTCGGESP